MSAGVRLRLPWMINIKLTFDICDDAWCNVVMVKEENTIHQTYLDLVYIINVRMWISEINELNKMYIYECGPGARCVEMSWPWWAPALLRSSTSHLSASHSTSRIGNIEHAGVNIVYCSIPLHCWSEEESFPLLRTSPLFFLTIKPISIFYSYFDRSLKHQNHVYHSFFAVFF